MDINTDRVCENCAHDWRGPVECPVCGFENAENDVCDLSGRPVAPPQSVPAPRPDGPWNRNAATLKVVCCWCEPWHVMREGIEPASHGACPQGVKNFEGSL